MKGFICACLLAFLAGCGGKSSASNPDYDHWNKPVLGGATSKLGLIDMSVGAASWAVGELAKPKKPDYSNTEFKFGSEIEAEKQAQAAQQEAAGDQ